MGKIKVLQFPVANSQGGITQYVLQNWKFIDKSKFQFDFATMSKSLDFADELEKEGCKIFYISCYAEENKEQFESEFRSILIEGKYDVVHLHTKQWKSFSVERIAKEAGVKKIIVHAHNAGIDTKDEERRKIEEAQHYQLRECMTENIATDYWACSEAASRFLFGRKIQKEKIKIMNNAIDVSKFKYDERIRREYREKFGVEEKYVIGNVGRLTFAKNQEFLINAFSKVCKDNEKIVLFFVGAGEKEEQLKALCNEKGINQNVYFLGKRSDTGKLYQMMDLFAISSRFEGLCLALVEAQMSGLKCICSESVPSEAIITKNVQVLPFCEQLWIDRMLQLSMNVERRDMTKEIKEAGYDLNDCIEKIQKEYENVK